MRQTASDPEAVFGPEGCAQVLAVGQSIPFRRSGPVSLPVDVTPVDAKQRFVLNDDIALRNSR